MKTIKLSVIIFLLIFMNGCAALYPDKIPKLPEHLNEIKGVFFIHVDNDNWKNAWVMVSGSKRAKLQNGYAAFPISKGVYKKISLMNVWSSTNGNVITTNTRTMLIMKNLKVEPGKINSFGTLHIPLIKNQLYMLNFENHLSAISYIKKIQPNLIGGLNEDSIVSIEMDYISVEEIGNVRKAVLLTKIKPLLNREKTKFPIYIGGKLGAIAKIDENKKLIIFTTEILDELHPIKNTRRGIFFSSLGKVYELIEGNVEEVFLQNDEMISYGIEFDNGVAFIKSTGGNLYVSKSIESGWALYKTGFVAEGKDLHATFYNFGERYLFAPSIGFKQKHLKKHKAYLLNKEGEISEIDLNERLSMRATGFFEYNGDVWINSRDRYSSKLSRFNEQAGKWETHKMPERKCNAYEKNNKLVANCTKDNFITTDKGESWQIIAK